MSGYVYKLEFGAREFQRSGADSEKKHIAHDNTQRRGWRNENEKIKDGGDIQSLSMGEVRWETEVEMSDILDVYHVTLILEYEGNDELGIEGGERIYKMYLFRPTWGKNGDFSSERTRLLEDKRDKIREIQ